MNDELLRTSLLDLFQALGENAKGILLAGGYGLYLKQLHLADTGQRTLINADWWPVPRATEDLDLMLSTEIVADAQSMGAIRAVLDRLQYKVVRGSEFLQFARTCSANQVVKVDLLTAQLDVLQDNPSIRADSRRARPDVADRPALQAHPTDGALALTESPLTIGVSGRLSDGRASSAQVRIPHPFTYLLMKLTAYRDRRHDADKDLGRHHALDVFRIVAMLTEPESDQLRQYVVRYAANPQVESCADLIRSDFARATATGVLAMRDHPLWQNNQHLDVFLETIRELLA